MAKDIFLLLSCNLFIWIKKSLWLDGNSSIFFFPLLLCLYHRKSKMLQRQSIVFWGYLWGAAELRPKLKTGRNQRAVTEWKETRWLSKHDQSLERMFGCCSGNTACTVYQTDIRETAHHTCRWQREAELHSSFTVSDSYSQLFWERF